MLSSPKPVRNVYFEEKTQNMPGNMASIVIKSANAKKSFLFSSDEE